MNITLEEPLTTPVYTYGNTPFNNLASQEGTLWCVKHAVLMGAQVWSRAVCCFARQGVHCCWSASFSCATVPARWYQVYGFPDMVAAREYKRRAYKYVGLDLPPLQQLVAAQTPRMITILDREKTKPRHIHNLEEVKVTCFCVHASSLSVGTVTLLLRAADRLSCASTACRFSTSSSTTTSTSRSR